MKKNIVIFYSHKGNTKKVANFISDSLKCDMIEIGLPKSRTGFFGFLKLVIDGAKKVCPPIILPEVNWNDYENIIIGSPIWGGTYSSPIFTLVTQILTHPPNYAIFSTSAGNPLENSWLKIVDDIEKAIGKPAVATINICNKQLKNQNWKDRLQNFLKVIE